MLLDRLKKKLRRAKQEDVGMIKIGELAVAMARRVDLAVPHEFSIFVPRVEIRQRYYRDNQLQYEREIIFDSLTIVHAPQRPPAGGERNEREENAARRSSHKMD